MRNKIYFYSPMPSDSTAYYRTSGVLPFIDDPNIELVDVSLTTNFNWSNLISCKVFLFQRPFTIEHVQLLTLLKDMGIKIIADYDDNLLSLDMYNPTYGLYQTNRPNILECLKLADEVWVSTASIGEQYGHKNTHVVPNTHNDYLYPVNNKCNFNTKTKIVSYRGGASHQADVNDVADSLIKTINDNQDWTFQFCGDRFTYLEMNCGDNYQIIGGMTIMQFFKYFYNSTPNIVIFPLCNTKFNMGKSNISWLEATYAGAAFFGNKELPEFIKPGVTDINLLNEYMPNGMDYIFEERNKESWEYICDNLLLSKVNDKRIERLKTNL